MSESIIIKEADQSRAFGSVERLETDTADGNSCFWVPVSERQLESAYITQNGEYTPEKYAFSDITVNVTKPSTSADGTDWDITVEPINPDIPEIGVPEISTPGIDLTVDPTSGLPIIEIGIHITTTDDETIHVEFPTGEPIDIHGPDLIEPVIILDVISIDYDDETGEWTITAIDDVTVDGVDYGPGVIISTWPATEPIDIVIVIPVDLPDISEILDTTGEIDISVDVDGPGLNISGLGLNGLDTGLSIDLGSLNIGTYDLPDEIRVIQQPDYKSGDRIAKEGLVIQAYRNGEIWEGINKEFPGGYIPLNKLLFSQQTAINNPDNRDVIWEGTRVKIINSRFVHTVSSTYDMPYPPSGYPHFRYSGKMVNTITPYDDCQLILYYFSSKKGIGYNYDFFIYAFSEKPIGFAAHYEHVSECSNYTVETNYSLSEVGWNSPDLGYKYHDYTADYNKIEEEWLSLTRTYTKNGQTVYFNFKAAGQDAPIHKANENGLWNPDNYFFMKYGGTYNENPSYPEITGVFYTGGAEELMWQILYGKVNAVNEITVSWPRPIDNKLLSATINITVEESDAPATATTVNESGFSHHSGKF